MDYTIYTIRVATIAGIALLSSSCGIPAFSSAMRSNGYAADVRLESRCKEVDRDRIGGAIKRSYATGWRLSFVSQYTSSARGDISAIVCFERPVRAGTTKAAKSAKAISPVTVYVPKASKKVRVYSSVDAATVVEHLLPGAKVELLGFSADRIWAKVSTQSGRTGWVAAHQLLPKRPAPHPRKRP